MAIAGLVLLIAVGQPGEPAAGARHGAAAGVRRPAGARRIAPACAAAGPDREPADRRARIGRRGGVAMVVSRSIPPLISTAVDRIHLDLAIDWQVFGFTAIVGVATALLFGMAPALRATRAAGVAAARAAAAPPMRVSAISAGRWSPLQIAVTLVLLFGGLLFLRTFQNLAIAGYGHQRARRRRRQRVLPESELSRRGPRRRLSRDRRSAARAARRGRRSRRRSRRRSADPSATSDHRSTVSEGR